MVCHEDLRSWKCKACGQAFNYKKLLQRHIQVFNEILNLKIFLNCQFFLGGARKRTSFWMYILREAFQL